VVVSNPAKTRAIAEARVKTDKVDAATLAQLLAADYLPAVWLPDEATNALRRQVIRRAGLVRHRTRLKNQVHAIGHRNLVPRCPASDLFGIKGRRWLAAQKLPADGQTTVAALLRQLDFHTEQLRLIDAELRRVALQHPHVSRLMSIPGVDATVALSIVAAVGEFTRFRGPEKLVAYLGLHPRVRQSGGHPAKHGPIHKQGRAYARGMLVEAAWAASKAPGPLRAFYQRVRARRGMRVAVVATARKIAMLCWQLATHGAPVRLRPTVAGRAQTPPTRAPRRTPRHPRPQRNRIGVLPQRRPRGRAAPRRTSRTGLPNRHRRLAAQTARTVPDGRRGTAVSTTCATPP
jgi:transposase